MDYETWSPLLHKIKGDIQVTWESDEKAAKELSRLLDHTPHLISFLYLDRLLFNKKVIVFGAGPSLEHGIKRYHSLFQDCILIAADGATSALIKNDIIPHIVVTDLDGDVIHQLYANKKGSILIVHAHGDNLNIVEKTIPNIDGLVIGSIQTNPRKISNVFNVGGFTDGDRGVYLAVHCNANKIYLIGFDFNDEIGQYSLPEKKDKELKIKKLRWCEILIDGLQQNNNIQFLTV